MDRPENWMDELRQAYLFAGVPEDQLRSLRITSYNVCYTKLLRLRIDQGYLCQVVEAFRRFEKDETQLPREGIDRCRVGA